MINNHPRWWPWTDGLRHHRPPPSLNARSRQPRSAHGCAHDATRAVGVQWPSSPTRPSSDDVAVLWCGRGIAHSGASKLPFGERFCGSILICQPRCEILLVDTVLVLTVVERRPSCQALEDSGSRQSRSAHIKTRREAVNSQNRCSSNIWHM